MPKSAHLRALLRGLLLSALLITPAFAQLRQDAPLVTPEPVVVAPITPAAVVVDLRDGFWMQALKTRDLDGDERTFVLIYFPKRYLTGPDTWTTGIREALVHYVGCETFQDCTPELRIRFYRRAPLVPVLSTVFESFLKVYVFPLVASPTSHEPVGIALID